MRVFTLTKENCNQFIIKFRPRKQSFQDNAKSFPSFAHKQIGSKVVAQITKLCWIQNTHPPSALAQEVCGTL